MCFTNIILHIGMVLLYKKKSELKCDGQKSQ